MSKIQFDKPGNFLYPLPAVMVSCSDKKGRNNIITIAWTGTVCSDPPMVYISVRKERYSYPMIKETGEFVINLPSEDLTYALDKAGCTTGKKIDKFRELGLTPAKSNAVDCVSIAEAPVCLECKVTQVLELGSHDMFLAEVVSVSVDEKFLDEKGVFHMDRCNLVAYEHGAYRKMAETIGTFGYSVRKKKN
ncbi:MAG: flavin reductase family protein [Lachnospiraceae bacterium]|nr:flavin reductase family protein [Lachnospiraceae bacterium]MBO7362326.1 flavin reductase family protein [Lachnospiraceae bacterium]MBP5252851.1 flavin reductase family protein [Lachnospiraceae bacterium]MBP5702155.1 flavin reductase family protein [Lachnospiraceae bacterium]MBP5763421.1 flavin reductase family protein [Lachnospiraceae bacterium]